jgi:prevent-host-death family protein
VPWQLNTKFFLKKSGSYFTGRNHISELIQQVVEQQQPLIIESEGKPQVVMLSIAEYERLLSASTVEVGQTPLDVGTTLRAIALMNERSNNK